MTLRDFIDAGYALCVENLLTAGHSLVAACEMVDGVLAPSVATPVDDRARMARANQEAMAALAGMLGGVAR